jgi:Ca2+-binding EF-hand superfamily protein
MKPIKELFDFYDNNSDGVISKREFVELVENLLHERGMGKSTEILNDYDFNENGVMDFDEFELFAKNQLGCTD